MFPPAPNPVTPLAPARPLVVPPDVVAPPYPVFAPTAAVPPVLPSEWLSELSELPHAADTAAANVTTIDLTTVDCIDAKTCETSACRARGALSRALRSDETRGEHDTDLGGCSRWRAPRFTRYTSNGQRDAPAVDAGALRLGAPTRDSSVASFALA